MKEAFKGRLNLTEKASGALYLIVRKLKDERPHVEINPSKLCSWIIEHYAEEHYVAEAERIAQAHFNPKRYVADRLKNANSEEEIKALFKEAVLQMGGSETIANKRKKVSKKKVDIEGSKSPSNELKTELLTDTI